MTPAEHGAGLMYLSEIRPAGMVIGAWWESRALLASKAHYMDTVHLTCPIMKPSVIYLQILLNTAAIDVYFICGVE